MPTDNDTSSSPVSSVVPLRGSHLQIFKHGEPNEEVVAKLEEMLEEARSGYLRAFAYARVTADRNIIHGWAGSCDQHDMTAAIAKLSFRFMYETYPTDEV